MATTVALLRPTDLAAGGRTPASCSGAAPSSAACVDLSARATGRRPLLFGDPLQRSGWRLVRGASYRAPLVVQGQDGRSGPGRQHEPARYPRRRTPAATAA